MMKKNKKIIAALTVAVLFTVVFVAADPGGANDPLISKSYIDSVLMPKIESIGHFELVSLPAGKKLLGSEGCEMIVRMGAGRIIATQKGGIADTTEGVDLANGAKTPSNHLLIIPLSDGRGILADNDMLIMVKGSHEIK